MVFFEASARISFFISKSTFQIYKEVQMPVISEERNQVVEGKGYKEEFHSISFLTL